MPPGPPEMMIFKQVDMHRITIGDLWTFNIRLSTKSEGERELVDGRLIPSFFFLFHGAHSLFSGFLRSLISPKEISPGETHSHADGTIPPEPLSLFLSLSIRHFNARSLSLSLLLCRSLLY